MMKRLMNIVLIMVAMLAGVYWYLFFPDYIGTKEDAYLLTSKGWIPDILPPGSYDIREIHNLDISVGWGTFRFQEEEAALFRQRLEYESKGLSPNERATELIAQAKSGEQYYLVCHGIWDGHALIFVDWQSLSGSFYNNMRGYIAGANFCIDE